MESVAPSESSKYLHMSPFAGAGILFWQHYRPHSLFNKLVSYCKQIARQHLCHKDLGQGRLRGRPGKYFLLIQFDHCAKCCMLCLWEGSEKYFARWWFICQGRIQKFHLGGHEAPKTPRSSAAGARIGAPQAPRGLGFGEGVSPSPPEEGSGEGAVPPPQKLFFNIALQNGLFW